MLQSTVDSLIHMNFLKVQSEEYLESNMSDYGDHKVGIGIRDKW